MRLPDRIEPGLVLKYGYLWADEAEQGREEGEKDRPAVVVLKRELVRGTLIVTVAAITHSPPRAGQGAVEVSPVIKERLGLDEQASWVGYGRTQHIRMAGARSATDREIPWPRFRPMLLWLYPQHAAAENHQRHWRKPR